MSLRRLSTKKGSRRWRRGAVWGSLLLAGGCAVVALQIARPTASAYDPAQSYAYTFSDARAKRMPITISHSGFTLPASAARWDTALARIEIAPTILGRWLTPSIEVAVNGEPVAVQYFEPGAKGVRFLNVSALHQAAAGGRREVALRGRRLTWQAQPSELLLFDNGRARKPKLVVVAPHPDDAELAAFGLYSRSETRIITITAGDSGGKSYGYLVPQDAQHFALKGRIRVWDSVTVPQLGGVTPAHAVNLGYFDGTLQQMFAQPDQPVSAQHIPTTDPMTFRKYNVANLSDLGPPRSTWSNLVADLTKLITEADPDIIAAPHPLLDEHSDHAFASLAVLEAVAAMRSKEVELYLYTNHVPEPEHFPFGPAHGVVGVPPWFAKETPFSGLYSMALTKEERVLKLFAFEAMHDARRGPPALQSDVKQDLLAAFNAFRDVIGSRFWGGAANYYRRAIRPNEVFFVYSGSEACALWRAFLIAKRTTHTHECRPL